MDRWSHLILTMVHIACWNCECLARVSGYNLFTSPSVWNLVKLDLPNIESETFGILPSRCATGDPRFCPRLTQLSVLVWLPRTHMWEGWFQLLFFEFVPIIWQFHWNQWEFTYFQVPSNKLLTLQLPDQLTSTSKALSQHPCLWWWVLCLAKSEQGGVSLLVQPCIRVPIDFLCNTLLCFPSDLVS